MTSIRVELPAHLRTLAGVGEEVRLEVSEPATIESVLDAIEAGYPMLRGTIRGHGGGPRRAFIRFFACGEDLSHAPAGTPLPPSVLRGEEPFTVIGAIAGG